MNGEELKHDSSIYSPFVVYSLSFNKDYLFIASYSPVHSTHYVPLQQVDVRKDILIFHAVNHIYQPVRLAI